MKSLIVKDNQNDCIVYGVLHVPARFEIKEVQQLIYKAKETIGIDWTVESVMQEVCADINYGNCDLEPAWFEGLCYDYLEV